MRWLFVLLGAAIIAAVAAVVMVLPSSKPAPKATPAAKPTRVDPTPQVSKVSDECGTFETKEKAPYAITGYWITPKSNPCTWRRQLKEIHDVGGDTVIRIGYGMQYRPVDDQGQVLTRDGQVDPRYKNCEEDGLSCKAAAERDLKALNEGNHISRVYAYRTDESFGPGIFRCPQVEKKIQVGNQVFFRLLSNTDGSDDATCNFARPQKYDLILVAASARDSLEQLLDLGDQFGVRVFPALPLAPRDPDTPTRAIQKHMNPFTTLTRRIVQDYGQRFEDREALGGLYQPFEVQMSATLAKNPTLDVYREQHEVVQQVLPGKPILISPYMDARKRVGFGQTPDQVAAAFRLLAETGVGIIAPQDSRGTGKVGLYWPDERGSEVDPRLKPVVGEATYGDAYLGSTRDYYRKMGAVRDQMVGEGYSVQLWANVEAFEPSGAEPCAAQGTRGKTDKERLDQAVTMAGRYVQKVVSYMWSDFYTCGSPSLEDEIAKDWQRPIAVDAIRRSRDIQDGVEVRGYNFAGATVTLSWEGGSKDVNVAAAGWLDDSHAVDVPEGMQTAWVPFDWTQVPPGQWLRITVKGASGLTTTEPLHVQIMT
ncbi:MAG: DUF4434 domain-containing protein [Nonomuraea sp.]|nr:DUF4434 domain-containing protein [Nonomuraea sp.]